MEAHITGANEHRLAVDQIQASSNAGDVPTSPSSLPGLHQTSSPSSGRLRPSNEKTVNKSKRPYPGAVKVHCNGRIVMGAKSAWFSVTVAMIVAFTAFIGYFLVIDIIKYLSVWAVIVDAILLVMALAMSFTTAWSDPGIIPRNVYPKNALRMSGATDYGVEGTISRLVFHESNPDFLFGKEIIANHERVFLKYCPTCEIFRPPRSSHCSFCDNCVEDFDHHCPWLSNCIGKRNHKYFIFFLTSLALLCTTLDVQFIVVFYRKQNAMAMEFVDALIQFWPISTALVMIGLTGIVLTLMVGYHYILVAKDLTTNEQVKLTRSAGAVTFQSNAASKDPQRRVGCYWNATRFICGPRQPRLIKWEQYCSSDDTFEDFKSSNLV